MPKLEFTVPGLTIPSVLLPLDQDYSASIGRSESADICIPIGSVSSLHCSISRVPGGYELRDMCSTNGIFFKEERVLHAILAPGSEVILGEATLTLTATDEEKATLHAENPASESTPAPTGTETPATSSDNDDFVDLSTLSGLSGLSGLNFDDDDTSDTVTPERETLISSSPQAETIQGIVLPPANPSHPEYGQLHYGASTNDDVTRAQPAPRRYAPPVAKSNYPAMVLYALIMFVLGIGTGVTVKYYSNTGELLPMVMLGIHSPKETIKQHVQQAQEELDQIKAESDAAAKAAEVAE